jgi:hypothetical protein
MARNEQLVVTLPEGTPREVLDNLVDTIQAVTPIDTKITYMSHKERDMLVALIVRSLCDTRMHPSRERELEAIGEVIRG